MGLKTNVDEGILTPTWKSSTEGGIRRTLTERLRCSRLSTTLAEDGADLRADGSANGAVVAPSPSPPKAVALLDPVIDDRVLRALPASAGNVASNVSAHHDEVDAGRLRLPRRREASPSDQGAVRRALTAALALLSQLNVLERVEERERVFPVRQRVLGHNVLVAVLVIRRVWSQRTCPSFRCQAVK